MLSDADNELLTRVGPGTPMGTLLRRYWMPALLSCELPEADGRPVRVRLLGEDLVAFRDSSGRPGLLANNCPHRGASLFFGRNEESGLRCVYHGWKFDIAGVCVDMPNEPPESNFKEKVRAVSYPTHESGGAIWTYMGPIDKMHPFRDFGSDGLPPESWRATKLFSSCNFVQAMEGNLDTAHISFLHRNNADYEIEDDGSDRPGYCSPAMSTRIRARDKAPHVEVEDTVYGYRYAGIRRTPNGHTHARMTAFAMPVMTFVAALPLGGTCGMFVPIDDHNCWRYQVTMQPNPGVSGQIAATQARPNGVQERLVLPENDYLIDREAQRSLSYTGIKGVVQQDLAVTESMGSIFNREQERLGTTDTAIIHMRQQLIRAARSLEDGVEPPGVDPTYPYHLIRSAEKILAPGESWRSLGTPADETYLRELGSDGATISR
jgi:phthalate 4,5-dioxygenase